MSGNGKICLVIPCYNEEKRLDTGAFLGAPENMFFIFVNDGSTDGTSELVRKHLSGHVSLLDLERNSGKAEAVRRGILHAPGLPFFEDVSWIGYWDADLSVSLDEAQDFASYAEKHHPGASAVFGSRIRRCGADIRRSFFRHAIGRFFAFVFRTIFGLETYDSQCGAKLFRKDAAAEVFREPFVSRWIFDVELILRLKGRELIEYPLRSWHEKGGSKVMKPSNAWLIARDIFRLWKKYG